MYHRRCPALQRLPPRSVLTRTLGIKFNVVGMSNVNETRSPVLGVCAIVASALLVSTIYWITKPGVAEFNAFNERVFGQYYTAGAIAMFLLYGLAFVACVGLVAVATVLAWVRNESPRWVTWAATLSTLVAPIASINLLKSA